MQKDQANISRVVVKPTAQSTDQDIVVVEEPLQIEFVHKNKRLPHSITMRTPGNDEYLVYGLLFSEGIIAKAGEVEQMRQSVVKGKIEANSIEISLSDETDLTTKFTPRNITSYSSCGICGKSNLKALELKCPREQRTLKATIGVDQIQKARHLLSEQPLFNGTGGSHVAAIVYEVVVNDKLELDFDNAICFEDVGRHNALDKLIGSQLVNNDLDKTGAIVLSGRVGFELVQKIVLAGFSTIIALGAPSDLSIKAANQFNVTLIGFAKDHQYNLYTF